MKGQGKRITKIAGDCRFGAGRWRVGLGV